MSGLTDRQFADLLCVEAQQVESMVLSQDFEAYYSLVKDDAYIAGLLGYAYKLLHFGYATDAKQLETSEVIATYNQLRGRIIDELRKTAREVTIKHRAEATKASELIKSKFRDMHKPSVHGTVAEIAERYGISKSAVRKMRADGTLDQLVNGKQE